MASVLNLLLEGETVLSLMQKRAADRTPKIDQVYPQGTKSERFIKLLSHKDWGTGIKSFLRVNPKLPLEDVIKVIKLKPSIHKWVQTGLFRGDEYKNPPTRQEIHDAMFEKYMQKKRLEARRTGEQNG